MNTVANRTNLSVSSAIWLCLAFALLLAGCSGGETSATQVATANANGNSHGEEAGHKEGEEGHVELAPAQIEKAGIVVAQAGPAEVREHLPLYGVIAPNAEHVLDVSARFPGVIRSVRKRVGDSVKRGDALATIESNESLQTYTVVAPLDGVVTQRNANEGAQTGDGPLFTVADLSTVWVELSVFPRDVAKIRVGQSVRVKSADTGLSAEGKVVYVAPFGSTTNQTLTARVSLPNKDQKWPPGLFVTAEVVLAITSVPLAVRSESLQTLDERTVVFVRNDSGFEARAVDLGRTDGEISEVRGGITVGESYATKNSFILKAELGKGEAEHED
jgi:cobalt-zinc-cadmium efflux system membrane fusion protein